MITKHGIKDVAVRLGLLERCLESSAEELDEKHVEAVHQAIGILNAFADDMRDVAQLKVQLEAADAQIRTQQSMLDAYQAELKSQGEELQLYKEAADAREPGSVPNDYRYFIP